MCGRFTLSVSAELLSEYFDLLEELDLAQLLGRPHPRWNIAPTENVLTVALSEAGGRTAVPARWGMAQSFTRGRPLFNTRSDKLGDSFWRQSFAARRCLVPVSSFYEWQDVGTKRKVPHEISLRGRPVAAFAGLWNEMVLRETGEILRWCSVITTDACGLMREIHNAGANRHRQPVFVDREDFAAYLRPGELDPGFQARVLRVRESGEFEARALASIGDDERGQAPRPQAASPDVQPGLPFG